MEAVGGVTAMDTRGFVMVSTSVPGVALPRLAMIVEVVFGVTPVASPPAVMVAPTDALQATLDVKFCVLWSKKVPVAVNCCVAPGGTDAVAGVTAMETSAFTISVAVPEIVPEVAVIVTVAAAVPAVASPPAVMVAPADALHVTLNVMFCG
jgi:hypothetical protein